MTTYETPNNVRLDLSVAAGAIELQTEERATTTVELEPMSGDAQALIDATEVECKEESGGHRVRVHVPTNKNLWQKLGRGGAVRIRVVAPTGASVEASTASADVTLAGELGAVDVKTASGDLAASGATVDTARFKTASGQVRFGHARSKVDVGSASGSITLAEADGAVDAKTMSGNVTVERAHGDVRAATMSGDVFLGGLSQGTVDAKSMSGDVVMDVVPGVRVWMDLSTLSGRAQSELDEGDETKGDAQLHLRASTKSGNVRVRRSPTAAAV
jgi:DUF4097 and DUF4098 domain-containing protein YvlB